MRDFCCYIYHYEDKKLVKNQNHACWAGLSGGVKKFVENKGIIPINLDAKTKQYIYIDNYIENEITDKQRKRIVYLINKITPCRFVKINDKIYIRYKLLTRFPNNLLLLNFIRILWYTNGSFNNKQFFIDICKPKPRSLDYLEFMMTCIKNNLLNENSWSYGDHSFVYQNIIPKKKELLLKYTGTSMSGFLQSKIQHIN